MKPREIRRLSEAEVLEKWLALYSAGKHAKVIREGHKAPMSSYQGRDPIWVEVEIPHEMYAAEWNSDEIIGASNLSTAQLDRSLGYANTAGRLPPGMASFSGRRSKKAYVSDGNHRAYASFLRGLPAARFYMPAGDWTRFLAANRGGA